MQIDEIRKLTSSEMIVKLGDLRKEIVHMAFNGKLATKDRASGAKKLIKKSIARIKTVINEKKNG